MLETRLDYKTSPVKGQMNILRGTPIIWHNEFNWLPWLFLQLQWREEMASVGGRLPWAEVIDQKRSVSLTEERAMCLWLKWTFKLEAMNCGLALWGMDSVRSTCPRYATHVWIPLQLSIQICGWNLSSILLCSVPTTAPDPGTNSEMIALIFTQDGLSKVWPLSG